MRISVDLIGTHALAQGLRERATMSLVKKAVRLNGGDMQRAMVTKAVFSGEYTMGATKDSITLRMEDNGYTVKVFPTTHYSSYVEYGTRFMSAQPFVRPAHLEVSPQFINDLKRLMK